MATPPNDAVKIDKTPKLTTVAILLIITLVLLWVLMLGTCIDSGNLSNPHHSVQIYSVLKLKSS